MRGRYCGSKCSIWQTHQQVALKLLVEQMEMCVNIHLTRVLFLSLNVRTRWQRTGLEHETFKNKTKKQTFPVWRICFSVLLRVSKLNEHWSPQKQLVEPQLVKTGSVTPHRASWCWYTVHADSLSSINRFQSLKNSRSKAGWSCKLLPIAT